MNEYDFLEVFYNFIPGQTKLDSQGTELIQKQTESGPRLSIPNYPWTNLLEPLERKEDSLEKMVMKKRWFMLLNNEALLYVYCESEHLK